MKIRFSYLLIWLLLPVAFVCAEDDYSAEIVKAYENADDAQKAAWAELSQTPEGLVAAGKYDEALQILKTRQDPHSLAFMADILLKTGRYDKASGLLDIALNKHPDSAPLNVAKGDQLCVRGKYVEALAAYAKATDNQQAEVMFNARGHMGIASIYKELAHREGAYNATGWFFEHYESFETDDQMTADDAYVIGAGAMIGAQYDEEFQDGFRVLAIAQKKDKNHLDATLAMGEAYAGKYQYPDAESEFANALKLNPRSVRAHLGMAEILAFKRKLADAVRHVKLALTINPQSVDALILMSYLDFIDEKPEQSKKLIAAALKINPNYPPAIRLKAAFEVLAGKDDEFNKFRTALYNICKSIGFDGGGNAETTISESDSLLFYDVSEMLSATHKVEKALVWAKKAVDADPLNAAAQAKLAISLMRNGLEKQAAEELEKAIKMDGFNVWIYNLRKLIQRDSLYTLIPTRRFDVKLFNEDFPVFKDYIAPVVDGAIERCEKEFGYSVGERRIKLAILKSHADFAARVTGLPQLDASGATFGPFVAQVSPAAFKRRGRFYNWESVALHEIAHVVSLMGTDYQIPRWLTEGMSVYMEGWITNEWDMPFRKMLDEERYPDILDWNRSFNRPQYGWEVPAAYHAAGLFVRWLVEDNGKEILPKLIGLYREGKDTTAVFQQALGKTPTQVNEWFKARLLVYGKTLQLLAWEDAEKMGGYLKAWNDGDKDVSLGLKILKIHCMGRSPEAKSFVEELYAVIQNKREKKETFDSPEKVSQALTMMAEFMMSQKDAETARLRLNLALDFNPQNAIAHNILGQLDANDGFNDDAEVHLRKAIENYPRYVYNSQFVNPYQALVQLLEGSGRKKEAVAVLEAYCDIRRDDPGAYRKLAGLCSAEGQVVQALVAYRKLFAVDPYVASDHSAYADLLKKQGRADEAEKEIAVAAACPTIQVNGDGVVADSDASSESLLDDNKPEADKTDKPKDAKVEPTKELDPKLKDFLDEL